MRFYTGQHKHYCGIDLHARWMYICILNRGGEIVLHRNVPAGPEAFLRVVEPFRDDLAVGVECMFAWYWVADVCNEQGFTFVLGHALYMKAIHGGKAKNDRIDSHKIAVLLRGGTMPHAYVYPREMRATRDLLRRRNYLVRKRSELLTHIQITNAQYNLPAFSKNLAAWRNRHDLADHFEGQHPSVQKSIAVDADMIDVYDQLLRELEAYIVRTVKVDASHTYFLLRTVPGIGQILGLVLLYEIHDISRFPRVQDFVSYCRLVKCTKESAGKKYGTSGAKIGNAHLKWAFSEAAMIFLREVPQAKVLVEKLTAKHGKGKALSILSRKLGTTVYYMLKRNEAFDVKKFFAS